VDLGTLALWASNTFGGAGKSITITGTGPSYGTVSAQFDANLGNSSNSLIFTGGHLLATGTFSTSRTITLGIGGGTFDVSSGNTLTIGSAMSGAGGLAKA